MDWFFYLNLTTFYGKALTSRNTGIDDEVADEDFFFRGLLEVYSYFSHVRNNSSGCSEVDAHPVIAILKHNTEFVEHLVYKAGLNYWNWTQLWQPTQETLLNTNTRIYDRKERCKNLA